MFNFFMVVGFICIPVLINYLCGKYISITMRFKLSGSDCVCRHHTISGFHHPKHLFCGIKRSSESSERAVEVMPISSLTPCSPEKVENFHFMVKHVSCEGKIDRWRKSCLSSFVRDGKQIFLYCLSHSTS